MSLEEYYRLEKDGIARTISSYSIDDYTLSYSEQLKNLVLPNDLERVLVIVESLLDWYNIKIDDILQSRFVMNKEQHKKTQDILFTLKKQLSVYIAD